MEYYSSIKKEQNNAICSNMDASGYLHVDTKWSKSERDIPYGMKDIPYTIRPNTIYI